MAAAAKQSQQNNDTRCRKLPSTGYCKGATIIEDIGEVYEIQGILGEGAFARVFKGRRRSDQKAHALKVIQTSHFAKERVEFRLHLLRGEVDVLQAVHHRNLVSGIECFETKDEIIIGMELLAGDGRLVQHRLVLTFVSISGSELFDALVAEEGGFTEARAATVIHNVVSGLEYLHTTIGAAHRDLKPENIMFRNPDNTCAVITDFGFAFLTQTGDLMKTACGSVSFTGCF